MQGDIINITRFCTDDGPGIRTTVLLKGCPLRCFWCHNPESQSKEGECFISGEKIGRSITAREVVNEVIRDVAFYEASGGGVTVSGGEPLLQPEFTAEILKLCKEKEIHTAIETSGYAGSKALTAVLEHCDLVLFDIKETNESNHLEYTGVSLEPILKNLKQINGMQIPFVIRMPIIPGFNDRQEHLQNVRELASGFVYCHGIQIMPYHKLGEYKYEQLGRTYPYGFITEPSKEQIEKWNTFLKTNGS